MARICFQSEKHFKRRVGRLKGTFLNWGFQGHLQLPLAPGAARCWPAAAGHPVLVALLCSAVFLCVCWWLCGAKVVGPPEGGLRPPWHPAGLPGVEGWEGAAAGEGVEFSGCPEAAGWWLWVPTVSCRAWCRGGCGNWWMEGCDTVPSSAALDFA